MPHHSKPTVALLVDTFRAYGRGLSRGIAAYAKSKGGWDFVIQQREPNRPVPSWLENWKGDGILCRVGDAQIGEALAALNCPVVDMYGQHRHAEIPLLDTDAQAVAMTAIRFYLDAAFTQFAFCGFPGFRFSDERQAAFISLLKKLGFRAEVFVMPEPTKERDPTRQDFRFPAGSAELEEWVASLSPQTAILACNDIRAQQLLIAAARTGRSVPEDLAVMGVDNDDVICELTNPSLSSIRPDTYTIGHTAAAWLDTLMQGKKLPADRLFVPPLGVQERTSTDIVPSDDPLFVKAVRYIRSNVQQGIDVKSVVDHVGCCRSTLEGRFRGVLKRSIKDELTRARLARAKVLLQETSITLDDVANSCGFATASHFSRVFKEKENTTPGQFRLNHQMMEN